MQLRCPECSTAYRVDDRLITGTQPTFRCSRCQHIFVVESRAATHEEQDAGGVIDTGPSGPETGDLAGAHPPAKDSERRRRANPGSTSDTGRIEGRGKKGRSSPPGPDDAQIRAQRDHSLNSAESSAANPRESQPKQDLESFRDDTRFDVDDDFFIFPKEETGDDGDDRTRTGGQISVLPFVSLCGILLFAFAIVTMTYQVDPAPLESLIRKIPWYGSAVFESKHFKRGLEFESLASGLQSVLGQNEVLMISGTLVNRNTRGVQNVQIQAKIYDAEGKPLGEQTVYLGNALSFKIIRDMTPREISLLQSLKPQNVYRVEPNESADFTIVLPKPKKGVGAFSCRVVSAEATA